MSPERKIIQLEKENLKLQRRILNLERKMDKMKADYETKLKAKKRIVMTEAQRQQLLDRRDKALARAALGLTKRSE